MNIQDNGTRAALFQALRTPGLSLDALAESDDTTAAAGIEASGTSAVVAAPQTVAADPGEALLKLDVWAQQATRYLHSDIALPQLQSGSRADQLADHVLSALG